MQKRLSSDAENWAVADAVREIPRWSREEYHIECRRETSSMVSRETGLSDRVFFLKKRKALHELRDAHNANYFLDLTRLAN